MMRTVKSALGVLTLLVGCSMILWPGVFAPSAQVDGDLTSATSAEESSAASLEEFLTALGIDAREAVAATANTEQTTFEIEEVVDVD